MRIFMEKNVAKKTSRKPVVKKGFFTVKSEHLVAGPPKEGEFTQSQLSHYARKYVQIHSAQSALKKIG